MNRRNFVTSVAALTLVPALAPTGEHWLSRVGLPFENINGVRWIKGTCKASNLSPLLAEGGPGQRLVLLESEIDCDEPLSLPWDADTIVVKDCRFTLRPGVSTAVLGEDVGPGPSLYLISNKVVWPTLSEAQTAEVARYVAAKGLPA